MNFLQAPFPAESAAESARETIVREAVFKASPARVFRAWTDPEEIVQWFGHRANSLAGAEIDLRVGGAWRFVLKQTSDQQTSFGGEYLDIDPCRLLVFTWSHIVEARDGKRKETPVSRVSVGFEMQSGNTLVRLVHDGIRSEAARFNVGGGWEASFAGLSRLFD